ncbi:MAG TPA: hypothetical protein VGJ54_01795, partial [Streptosporangiaceae bacterium]
IAAHDPVILSDHDLAVIQKAVAAARQDGKDDRQDAAAGQHGTGPGPGPPAEEPRETRPPEARCSAPPAAIAQALPAANTAPPWGTVLANAVRLWTRRRFWPATRWRVISALILVPGPGRAVGGAGSVPEPAAVRRLDGNRTRRPRRLLFYALAAASIVVAAALVDHWGVLPTVGANTSSSPGQAGGPAQRPQLLPPLDQPRVMHFGKAVGARPAPAEPSAQPASPAAGLSGAQSPAARPAGSPASAESPRSATGVSSGGGPAAIAGEG